jgi:hypothetical protein
MAKKQTRRSISVSKATYERLKGYCTTARDSMSAVTEAAIADWLDGSDVAPRTPALDQDQGP